jgi:hypothetical protein
MSVPRPPIRVDRQSIDFNFALRCPSRLLTLIVIALLANGSVYAQQTMDPEQSVSQSPVGGAAGSSEETPRTFFPGVDLSVARDSNVQLSNTNPRSSSVTIVSPYLRAEGRSGQRKFDATARVDSGHYANSSGDNYTDASLVGNGDFTFSERSGLKLRAEDRHGHDPRGTTNITLSSEPDRYNQPLIDGIFSYGAKGAAGRIELEAGALRRSYVNNRLYTDVLDRRQMNYGATFFWRVAPKTELLAEARRTNFKYDTSTQLDSAETRLYIGAKWEATAATEGTVRVGRLNKDFDSAAVDDISSSSWEVSVRWSPLSYSVFDLTTSKQTYESTGAGSAMLTTISGLAWSHDWSSRVRSQLQLARRKDDFPAAVPARTDNTTITGAYIGYQFRRWMRLGAAYTHTSRDSDIATYVYARNVFMLSALIAL